MQHNVVSREEWQAAREQLLVKEKALTRARDALAAERRRMPWLAVERRYAFDGPNGPATLLDLFEGRRQLIVYRAFLEPGVKGWPDHACIGCSFMADQVAHLSHLNARDTTLVFASRAPQADIARVKARMGWTMPWYTITDDFDKDFDVDEWHGTNAFIRNGDDVFRTYFINERGDEGLGSTWSYLDMTALGRQETWEDSPEGYPQTPPYEWWEYHDEYPDAARPNTALLVVDVQAGVVKAAHARDTVVANIAGLVEKAREARVPVIWVQHNDDQLVRGSDEWKVTPELAPAASEPLVEKRYGDAFEVTPLANVLARLKVGRLLVVGAETDACVRSTLHGALARGYDATLVSDAHTTNDRSEWRAPPPDQVIAHTNLYWTYQTASRSKGGTVATKDVTFD